MADFIKDITISKMQWNLKVRVVRMWEVPDRYNKGTTSSIQLVLQDEKGDRIHAVIGKSVVHNFKTKINELGLYHMANFIVCPHKEEKFNTTKHKLRLNFTQKTTVIETTDQLFPMSIFDLRPYDQLIGKVDVNETELFDVIGEIVNFGEVQTLNRDGVSRKFMNLELEDDEGNRLSSTFWGEFVDQIVPHLLSSNNQPIVVVMQLIQAHKFQGSYSVRNTWNASKLWINPNFPQSDEFKTRLLALRDSCSERLTQTISQQSNSVSDELAKGIAQVKTIGGLVESTQEGPCWIVATIALLELQRGWSYLSCKKCQKSVHKLGNIYQCQNPKCKHEDNSAVTRYKLQVRVVDCSGSVSLLLWDHEAMFLIGKSAHELKEGLLENTGAVALSEYPVELNNILERTFLFKVIVKSSNIHKQDEVYSVGKLTDEEHLIKKYTPASPSDAFTDPDFITDQSVDGDKESKEATGDSDMTSALKTYDKRTRSANKASTVVDDEDLNCQLSSNKVRKVIKKEKNP